MARKLPKKPKAPKQSASYATWQNYEARLSEWKKNCAQIKSDAAKKAALIKKLRAGKIATPARKRRKASTGAKKKTARKRR